MVNFAGSRSRPLIAETITGVVREARLGLIVRSVSIHVNTVPGAPPQGEGVTSRPRPLPDVVREKLLVA